MSSDPYGTVPGSQDEADPNAELFEVLNGYWEALQRDQSTDIEEWATTHSYPHAKLSHLRVVKRLHDALQVVREESTLDEPSTQAPSAPAGQVARQFLEPGTLIDQCRIERLLGHGGMGEVYLAEHIVMGNKVAVKVLPAHRIGDADAVRRFQQEVRVLARMNPHPNVAAAFHASEYQGRCYLVMEYVPGMDLREHVCRHGPLPCEQACALVRQIAVGLEYVHGHYIVHRDLKPSNLRLTPEGTVKILDLGLARHRPAETLGAEGSLTPDGAVLGTLDYMAPEQAQSAGQADARSDLYSLGCTFYYLLTGKAPFAGHFKLDKLVAHARDLPAPVRQLRPEMPEAVAAVVEKLLEKKPEDRYPSAGALVEALDTAATATQPPAGAQASPRRNKTRRRWAVTAGGFLVLVAAITFWFRPSYVTPSGGTRDSSPPVPPMNLAALGPLHGSLDVSVYEKDNPTRQNLALDDAGAMPLRIGDQFDVVAELNRPAFVYVLWVDPDGSVQPLYPWRPGHWDERPEQEEPTQRLRRPEAADAYYWIKPGQAGMITMVLLGRDTPLPRDIDLRTELGILPEQKEQDLRATAWFENGMRVKNRRGREGLFDETRRADPLLEVQERIRQRLLGRYFDYSLAVSFARRGR